MTLSTRATSSWSSLKIWASWPGEQGYDYKCGVGDGHRHGQQPFEHLADPLEVFCPEVIAHDGLGPLGDSLDGHDHHLHHALHNRKRSHIKISAKGLKTRIENDSDPGFLWTA